MTPASPPRRAVIALFQSVASGTSYTLHQLSNTLRLAIPTLERVLHNLAHDGILQHSPFTDRWTATQNFARLVSPLASQVQIAARVRREERLARAENKKQQREQGVAARAAARQAAQQRREERAARVAERRREREAQRLQAVAERRERERQEAYAAKQIPATPFVHLVPNPCEQTPDPYAKLRQRAAARPKSPPEPSTSPRPPRKTGCAAAEPYRAAPLVRTGNPPHHARMTQRHRRKRIDLPASILENNILRLVTKDGTSRSLRDLEHDILEYALDRHAYQISETSRALKISRSTLYRKMTEHRL